MCKYCERRQDYNGWDQPKLPYHDQSAMYNLSGNVLDNEKWDGVIHDYKTTSPQLILTNPGYFDGEGVGTIYIPIKYCPECGRKLGPSVEEKPDDKKSIQDCISRLELEIKEREEKIKKRFDMFSDKRLAEEIYGCSFECVALRAEIKILEETKADIKKLLEN